MIQDDAAERKARAERLRGEIRKLTQADKEAEDGLPDKEDDPADAEPPASEAAPPKESPREFIHRRMRQIDEGEKDID